MNRRAGKTNVTPRGSKRYNRTPVTTYYRSDAGPSSQSPFQKRLPKRNNRKYLFGAADIILAIGLFGLLVYSLMLNDKPAVMATDNSYHSNSQYAALVKPAFAGVGDHNKITFNDSKTVQKIESQLPEVTVASIELPFFSEQPRVRLLISPPAFKLKSAGRMFIVSQNGVVVTPDANSPRFAKLLTVDDQSGFNAAVGQRVLNSQAAAFISTIIQQSQRAKVPLSQLTLPAIPLEFDLRTKDQPYFVKFYLNGDANLEVGQFLAARQKFINNHITPSQYLDVRIAGKIFYK